MQLRTLQTIDGLGPTASNTVVLAVPIDVRSSAVVLKGIGGRSHLLRGQPPAQRLPAASSAGTGELAVRQSTGWRFELGVRRPTRVNRAKDRSKLARQPA